MENWASYLPTSILSHLLEIASDHDTAADVKAALQPPFKQQYEYVFRRRYPPTPSSVYCADMHLLLLLLLLTLPIPFLGFSLSLPPPPRPLSNSTAVLFADISGYTALCEALEQPGAGGDEELARSLNQYFTLLLRTIMSHGGDVFKFAGDALLVLWPSRDATLEVMSRRAAQCALDIKENHQDMKLSSGVTLNVKVGVGVGHINILHVGGVFDRIEYMVTGQPFVRAFQAEHHAKPRQSILSPEVWDYVRSYFEASRLNDGFMAVESCLRPLPKQSLPKSNSSIISVRERAAQLLKGYIPSAVLPFVNAFGEQWASELRHITVLFVNLGLTPDTMNNMSDENMQRIHNVIRKVQRAVYRYEGSLNKFLMDDKGSTLIAVFGLPPLAHEDDAVRGVLSALAICSNLHELGLVPSIGVTTGMAFCGLVGSQRRREYSVLGDTVNLSARLMQHATKQGGGIICDKNTHYAAENRLIFYKIPAKIHVKGKKNKLRIYHPYPERFATYYAGALVRRKDRQNGANAPSTRARRSSVERSSLYLKQNPRRRFMSIAQIEDSVNVHSFKKRYSQLTFRKADMPTPLEVRDMNEDDVKLAELEATEYQNSNAPGNKSPGRRSGMYSVSPDSVVEQIHAYQKQGFAQQQFLQMKKDRTAKNKPKPAKRGSAFKDQLMGQAIGQKQSSSPQPSSSDNSLLAVAAPPMPDLKIGPSSTGIESSVSHHLIKAARVLYPDKSGHYTIDCSALSTVSQLKVEVFQKFLSRRILPEHAMMDDYVFVFTDTNIRLHDNMELDLLPSLLRANDIEASSVAELLFLRTHDQTGQAQSDTDETAGIHKLISRRIRHLAANRHGGVVIIEGEVGLGKTQLLATTVLEAPSAINLLCGSGNPFEMTEPFMVFRDIFLQALDTYIGHHDPFPSAVAAAGTATDDSVTDAVEEPFASVARPDGKASVDLDEHRRNVIIKSLRAFAVAKKAVPGQSSTEEVHQLEDLFKFAPVLNEVLFLGFTENALTSDLDTESRRGMVMQLLIALFTVYSADMPMLCAVEDAMYLDAYSWELVFQLSQCAPHVLLVLATRPMHNRTYRAAFLQEVPDGFRKLVGDAATTVVVLQPRSDEVIYQIACDRLKVHQMHPVLTALILQKSHGNPRLVQEFVYGLKEADLVYVEDSVDEDTKETRQVAMLARRLQLMDLEELIATFTVPVPITLQAVLGCRLDRLTHVQRMVMKVASIIGDEFAFELLYDAYPLRKKTKELLSHAVRDLIDMTVIRRVTRTHGKLKAIDRTITSPSRRRHVVGATGTDAHVTAAASPSTSSLPDAKEQKANQDVEPDRTMYMFSDGFMRDMVLSRMLSEHKDKLVTLVHSKRTKHLKRLSQTVHLRGAPRFTGTLQVCPERSSDWHSYFCVLTGELLSFWDSEEDFGDPDTVSGGGIFLEYSSVQRVDQESSSMPHALQLTAKRWTEGADVKEGEHVFLLAAPNSELCRRWKTQITSAVIDSSSIKQRSMVALAEKARRWKQQRLRLGLEVNDSDEKQVTLSADQKDYLQEVFVKTVLKGENSGRLAGMLTECVQLKKYTVSRFFANWKTRWMTLTNDCLYFRQTEIPVFPKREIKSVKDQNAAVSFTDCVALNTGFASVEMSGEDPKKGLFLIKVTCDLWMKRMQPVWKQRPFIIGLHSIASATQWVQAISKVIKTHRTNIVMGMRQSSPSMSMLQHPRLASSPVSTSGAGKHSRRTPSSVPSSRAGSIVMDASRDRQRSNSQISHRSTQSDFQRELMRAISQPTVTTSRSTDNDEQHN
jgi:class 3 adenylate cyclase